MERASTLPAIKHSLSLLKILGITFCLIAGTGSSHAQNISGIINQYAKVTYINTPKTKVRVVNNIFAANDKVLVIQMKGAAITTTNTTAYGDITGYNNAGYYEFSVVQSVNADTVTFSGPLCRNFTPADSVQIIKVPVYNNPVVTSALTCPAWGPGGTGGVLVFEATNTLTLNANIDVSEKGFRGGNIFGTTFNCFTTNYFIAASQDGHKGEAIADHVPNQFFGRGKLANGGGGASGGNSGGGGGANAGSGGIGGYQYTGQGCTPTAVQGAGGANLSYVSERVFLGGGGGGPQRDNGNTVYNGGNGGGIVLIKAASIVGNGNQILSNGQNITGIIADEGTSGGGAGGSVYLFCSNFTGPLTISAKGGFGGSNFNTLFPTLCHGPGGGGGGGIISYSAGSAPAGVTTNITGGAAGTVNNPASACYNTTHGAGPGTAGSVQFGLPVATYATLGLNDTFVCSNNFSINLSVGTGFSSILWSTSQTTPTITVTSTGMYTVEAINSIGCIARDTVNVILDTMTLGKDTTICPSSPLILTPLPTGNYTSYQWQNNSTASTFTVTQSGIYRVTVTTIHNCVLKDTIKVTLDTIPQLRDTFLCTANFAITLAMPQGYQSYLWNTTATTPSIIVTQPGTYTVQVVTAAGCSFSSSALIGQDVFTLGNDTVVCQSVNYTLVPLPATLFTSYLWQNGSTNPTFQVVKGGTYYVTVHTTHNCILSDTVKVQVDTIADVNFKLTDSLFCQGNGLLFTADFVHLGFRGLEWDFGDGTVIINRPVVSHAFDKPGTYTITLTGHYRICPDAVFTKDITVKPYPVLNLQEDVYMCPNGAPFTLKDELNVGTPGATWLWNTGETGSSILVHKIGIYYTTVTVDGCSTSDSTEVFKDCYLDIPNSFTPNGDGINDYFFPRQLLSRSVKKFEMHIYSRWGQSIFETTNISGRGWDGMFNDVAQPQGVFVYLIEVLFENGTSERYTGNVTLLR